MNIGVLYNAATIIWAYVSQLFSCVVLRILQEEIQKLLKEIAKHNLGRMDNGLFSSIQVDRVATKNKQEIKKITVLALGVEADLAAMHGVIEKGTRMEKDILLGARLPFSQRLDGVS